MHLSRDNLIVLGILTVIAITYFAVIYRAQSATADDVRTRTAESERRIKADAMQASRVPPMLREIEKMKQRYNKDWDRRLPQRQELAGFLHEIASGLSHEQLSNQIIRPGNPSRKPLYNCLPIIMKFEGDFLALAGFLKRVNEMTRLTRIEHLMIRQSQDSKREIPAGGSRLGTSPKSRQAAGGNLPGGKAKNLTIELGMNIYFTEQ